MAHAPIWECDRDVPLLARCTAYLARKAESRGGFDDVNGGAPILVSRACKYAHRMADRVRRLQQLQPDTRQWQSDRAPHFGRWLRDQVARLEEQSSARGKKISSPDQKKGDTRATQADKSTAASRRHTRAPNRPIPGPGPSSPPAVPHWSKLISECEQRVQLCQGSAKADAKCDAMAALAGTVAALIGMGVPDVNPRAVVDAAVGHVREMVLYSRLRKRSPKALLANLCTVLTRCRTVQSAEESGASACKIPSGFLNDLMMLACDATELVMSTKGGEPHEFALLVHLSLSLGGDLEIAKGCSSRQVVASVGSTAPLLNRLGDVLGQRTVVSNKSATKGLEAKLVSQAHHFWSVAQSCYDRALEVTQERIRDVLPLDLRGSPEVRKPQEVVRAYSGLRAQVIRDTGFVRLACSTHTGATSRETLLVVSRLLADSTRLFRYEARNLAGGRRADAVFFSGPDDDLLTTACPIVVIGHGCSRPPDPALLPDLIRLMPTFAGFYLVQAMCLAYRVCVAGAVDATAVGVVERKGTGGTASVRIDKQAKLRFGAQMAAWVRGLERVLLPCLSRVGAELDTTRIPGEEHLPGVSVSEADVNEDKAEYEACVRAYAEDAPASASGRRLLEETIDDEEGFFVGPTANAACAGPPIKVMATHLGENSFIYRLFHLYYDTMVTQLLVCENGTSEAELALRRTGLAVVLARERAICSSPLALPSFGAPSALVVVNP